MSEQREHFPLAQSTPIIVSRSRSTREEKSRNETGKWDEVFDSENFFDKSKRTPRAFSRFSGTLIGHGTNRWLKILTQWPELGKTCSKVMNGRNSSPSVPFYHVQLATRTSVFKPLFVYCRLRTYIWVPSDELYWKEERERENERCSDALSSYLAIKKKRTRDQTRMTHVIRRCPWWRHSSRLIAVWKGSNDEVNRD